MMRNMYERMFGSFSSGRSSPSKMDSSSSEGHMSTAVSSGLTNFMADRSEALLQRVGALYNSPEMSDVTLIVGGREFLAHRLMLCASSEVFQVMLMNKQWIEAQENRVELQESELCAGVFDLFLAFFYTGRLIITQEAALPLLCLADKYNVKELIELCVEYMVTHIPFAAKHGLLVSWLQYTQTCDHLQAAKACHNFVKWNFTLVAGSTDFGQFEPDVFISLLQLSDLVVTDEMQLYSCVVKWLELQRERLILENGGVVEEDIDITMTALIEATMSHIRFPMISHRQLGDLLLCPFINNRTEFFVEKIRLGLAFHMGQTDARIQAARLEEGGDRLFTPRLYTADTWSAILTIDYYSFVQPYETRTLVFSSPRSFADIKALGDRSCEWVVDMYPRGVWFKKGMLIGWQGTKDIPEAILRTVRLSVTCRDPKDDMHFKIGILVYGNSAGIEHIASVTQINHYFHVEDRVLNVDNLLPFESINKNNLLVGPNGDTLKVHIIIAPLYDVPRA